MKQELGFTQHSQGSWVGNLQGWYMTAYRVQGRVIKTITVAIPVIRRSEGWYMGFRVEARLISS